MQSRGARTVDSVSSLFHLFRRDNRQIPAQPAGENFFLVTKQSAMAAYLDHEAFGLDVARSNFCVAGTVPPASRQRATG